MQQIDLTAGTLDYQDTGGDGPVVVLLGGLVMDETLWRDVVADLRRDHRCIVPVMPLGGHKRPMREDADLSMRGLARLVVELLDRLELRDVVLAGNDHGLPLVIAAEHPERIGRLVITPMEAFDNIPPGLPGKTVGLVGRIPGGLALAMKTLRGPAARMPWTFGWMAKHGIPADVLDSWTRGARSSKAIRRDVAKYMATTDYTVLLQIEDGLRRFDRPALVAWAAEDRVMPPEHGRRLAALLPDARHVEIPDSFTLVPLDNPQALVREIRGFLAATAGAGGVTGARA
jgi:pimeloyl-ACP methyl ester carboxylesterase